ncbi:MAG: hypothetical protein J5643_00240 [Lachnospiraceae bacterium]|nr:hypothetical protein [Lachnospiraceae bacterium]
MENLNMVYAMAGDQKKPFSEADDRFEEMFQLLKYYQCNDAAAEQAHNFASLAYVRGEYIRAMELTADAVETVTDETKREEYEQTLHDMAYRLLAIGLTGTNDKALLDHIELILGPEDYQNALHQAAGNLQKETKNHENATAFIRRLALEVLRQAIRIEPVQPQKALSLLREALPWLNEKRAEPVRLEIQRLERITT